MHVFNYKILKKPERFGYGNGVIPMLCRGKTTLFKKRNVLAAPANIVLFQLKLKPHPNYK